MGCGAAFFWLSIIIPQGQALRRLRENFNKIQRSAIAESAALADEAARGAPRRIPAPQRKQSKANDLRHFLQFLVTAQRRGRSRSGPKKANIGAFGKIQSSASRLSISRNRAEPQQK